MRKGEKGLDKGFADFDDARLAYDLGQVSLHARIKVKAGNGNGASEPGYLSTTVGRILFNELLPQEMGFRNERMDKGALKRLVGEVFRRFRHEKTAEVLDKIKRIGFQYATKSGITIAIEDIKIPEQKDGILAEADVKVGQVEKQFRRGLITDDERYAEVIEIWTKAKEDVTAAVKDAMDPYGSVNLMAILWGQG